MKFSKLLLILTCWFGLSAFAETKTQKKEEGNFSEISSSYDVFAIPEGFTVIGVKDYFKLLLAEGPDYINLKEDVIALKNSDIITRYTYKPRLGVSAGVDRSKSFSDTSVSYSNSRTAGLSLSGSVPYGFNYSLSGPSVSYSESKSAGTRNTSTSASMSASLGVELLSGSYFVEKGANYKTYKKGLETHDWGLIQSFQSALIQSESDYFNLFNEFNTLNLEKYNLRSLKGLIEDQKVMVELGLTDQVSLSQSILRLARAKSNLRDVEVTFWRASENFKEKLGAKKDYYPDLTVLNNLPKWDKKPVNYYLEYAKKHRLSFLEQKLNLELQRYSLDSSASALYPSLSLSTTYNHSGSGRTVNDALTKMWGGSSAGSSVGLSFSYTLFGNTASYSYQNQKISFRKAQRSFEQVERTLEIELEDVTRQLEKLIEQMNEMKVTVKLAKKNLDGEYTKYRLGEGRIQDVLDSQVEFNNTLQEEAQLKIEYMLTLSRLNLEIGAYPTDIDLTQYL